MSRSSRALVCALLSAHCGGPPLYEELGVVVTPDVPTSDLVMARDRAQADPPWVPVRVQVLGPNGKPQPHVAITTTDPYGDVLTFGGFTDAAGIAVVSAQRSGFVRAAAFGRSGWVPDAASPDSETDITIMLEERACTVTFQLDQAPLAGVWISGSADYQRRLRKGEEEERWILTPEEVELAKAGKPITRTERFSMEEWREHQRRERKKYITSWGDLERWARLDTEAAESLAVSCRVAAIEVRGATLQPSASLPPDRCQGAKHCVRAQNSPVLTLQTRDTTWVEIRAKDEAGEPVVGAKVTYEANRRTYEGRSDRDGIAAIAVDAEDATSGATVSLERAGYARAFLRQLMWLDPDAPKRPWIQRQLRPLLQNMAPWLVPIEAVQGTPVTFEMTRSRTIQLRQAEPLLSFTEVGCEAQGFAPSLDRLYDCQPTDEEGVMLCDCAEGDTALLANGLRLPLIGDHGAIQVDFSGLAAGVRGEVEPGPMCFALLGPDIESFDSLRDFWSLWAPGAHRVGFLRRGADCSDGSFEFAHVPPGKYELVVTGGGRMATEKVELTDAMVDLGVLEVARPAPAETPTAEE